MEDKKLFNQIKSAAENAEAKDFPGMEKVWSRVEEKLDKKEDKKAIWRWKKIAVAASLLLVATLGYQFFKNNLNNIKPTENLTVTDSIQKTTPITNDVVIAEPESETKPNATKLNPVINKNAEQILQKQITSLGQVALEEDIKSNDKVSSGSVPTNQMGYFSAPAATQMESDLNDNPSFKAKKGQTKDVELFMNKSSKASIEKKEEPLVVIENKVVKEKLENIEFSAADSLVVLNEPLYIINGVEYTEQQVFGPNPTSPYTPLNKQDIETISILQNEKAIEIYGDKGKKGVVIITTKKGIPASAKINASKKAK